MKKITYILYPLIVLLGGTAAALWLLPPSGQAVISRTQRYGLHEGLELVSHTDGAEGRTLEVADSAGNRLFTIPLRECVIDTRYRNGMLRFREQATRREGFVDREGRVTWFPSDSLAVAVREKTERMELEVGTAAPAAGTKAAEGNRLPAADLRRMAHDNPFYQEAAKVLSGRLTENDSLRRRMILDYCERFRTAYTAKDLVFLRQVFGEHALIIVGSVIREKSEEGGRYLPSDRVAYNLRTKKEYLDRLAAVFASNRKIDVRFSDFAILRHPTVDGIYGVSLRQQYRSDSYADDGRLFLLWDFRRPEAPCIHVRTWQPEEAVARGEDILGIGDFNLE